MINIINNRIRNLEIYNPGKPIDDLKREIGIKNIIKLASNESVIPISKKVASRVKNAIVCCQRYPDGNGYTLKKKLSEKLSVSINQITLGNGSDDIFGLVMRSFVDPKDNVIISQYAFAAYAIACHAAGANLVEIPAINWGHDLDGMSTAINKNTRIIFIANPNNPTGTWVTNTALTEFLKKIPTNVLVVVDEAYFEYMTMLEDYPDTISLMKYYPNLIITRTFSKAYGLAGFRVGYAISNIEVADVLNRVRLPFNVNSLGLVAAQTALEDAKHLTKVLHLTKIGMDQMSKGLDEIGLSYISNTANFITINIGADAIEVYNAMLLKGIIVRPLQNYKMSKYLRISIGLPRENIRVIRALRKILRD